MGFYCNDVEVGPESVTERLKQENAELGKALKLVKAVALFGLLVTQASSY